MPGHRRKPPHGEEVYLRPVGARSRGRERPPFPFGRFEPSPMWIVCRRNIPGNTGHRASSNTLNPRARGCSWSDCKCLLAEFPVLVAFVRIGYPCRSAPRYQRALEPPPSELLGRLRVLPAARNRTALTVAHKEQPEGPDGNL